MTALRLSLNEVRRLTSGKLPRLALIAMMLVPTLYGGLYLYANNDPYAGLSRVPAAVVVEDAGTTLANGERLNAGPTVAHDLVASGSFDWHEVDRAEATAGVADGRYDFALVVPTSFSADLASSAEFTPRQAHLEVATNDANNYIAHTIANQLVAQVTKSVAEKVSSTAASQLLHGYSTIHSKVSEAVDGASKLQVGLVKADAGAETLATGAGQLVTGEKALVAGTTKLRDGATKAAAGATTLASGSDSLATGLETLDSRTATLPAQTRALAIGAHQVSDGNVKVADAAIEVAAASEEVIGSMKTTRGKLETALRMREFSQADITAILSVSDKIGARAGEANAKVRGASARLATLSAGAKQVASGAEQLANAAGPLHDGIHQAAGGAVRLRDGANTLSSGLDQLSPGAASLATGQQSALDGANRLATGAGQLKAGLEELSTGTTKIHDGLATGLRSIPNPSEASRKAVAQTIGSPVAVANTTQGTAGSYGAGLAPFFLSLALWIGAYVLFLLVKPLSSRALVAGQPSWRIALGGWLTPALFGLAQGVLVFTVVFVGIGIDAEHPVAVLALMFFTSITFVAILHALVAWLGSVGKFLGLVFMVMQLVSAGGTFPWQTLPLPLHALHHVLPMGYTVDAIRSLMYGGSLARVGGDMLVLTAYLLLALWVSTLAARRARVWTPARVKPELVLGSP